MRKTGWFYAGYIVILVNCSFQIYGWRSFEEAVIGSLLGLVILLGGLEESK